MKRAKHSVLVLFLLAALLLTAVPASAEGEMEYTIKGGESLSEIAQAHGLTLAKVLAANPQISDPNYIVIGQVITLPAGRWEGPQTVNERLFRWQVEADGTKVVKTDYLAYVHGGDNWIRMARKYNLTADQLKAANPQIHPTADLRKGELIHIPIHLLDEGVYSFYETP